MKSLGYASDKLKLSTVLLVKLAIVREMSISHTPSSTIMVSNFSDVKNNHEKWRLKAIITLDIFTHTIAFKMI